MSVALQSGAGALRSLCATRVPFRGGVDVPRPGRCSGRSRHGQLTGQLTANSNVAAARGAGCPVLSACTLRRDPAAPLVQTRVSSQGDQPSWSA